MSVAATDLKYVLVSRQGQVATVQLNRPEALNALSPELMADLATALRSLDADPEVRAIVLTGSERAFAAGADIKAMATASPIDLMQMDLFKDWAQVPATKKPIVAAVSGFVLGGGCELMMMCDLVVASETTKLGQPEINLGVIPGAGGTQRLTKIVGKHRAMELVLTGRQINAQESLAWGLVNKVVPVELVLEEAQKLAAEIASKAPWAVRLGKEAVLLADETHLSEGLTHERKNFHLLFASQDQKEGMAAFAEKRKPQFTGA